MASQGWLSHYDPSQLPVHPQSPQWWGREGAEKALAPSAAQAELKHPCVIKIVSSTNPKQTPIPDPVKKIDSIQHKTSAAGTSVRHTCRDKSQTASSPMEQKLFFFAAAAAMLCTFTPPLHPIFLLFLEKKKSKQEKILFINYLPTPKLILLDCYRLVAPRTKISLRIHCQLRIFLGLSNWACF